MYEKIEALLKERGETVADFCRATGISPSTMTNLKKRKNNLLVDNAKKAAEYLEVSIESLTED